MALPPPLRGSATPYELEFVAGEELIDIVPTFRMERIRLVAGVYGPFRPPAKARVPIWMAANLKLKKKCRVVPPDWLSVDYLQEKLNEETGNEEFSELPFRFTEIAKVLLDVAPDDLSNPDRIRSLLKDLREARQSKSREGLRSLDHLQLSLPNICSMEINEIRPFLVRAMGVLQRLASEPQDEGLP